MCVPCAEIVVKTRHDRTAGKGFLARCLYFVLSTGPQLIPVSLVFHFMNQYHIEFTLGFFLIAINFRPRKRGFGRLQRRLHTLRSFQI